jgi:hypothetical protein
MTPLMIMSFPLFYRVALVDSSALRRTRGGELRRESFFSTEQGDE